MRILVVEADRKVAGFIEMGLREEGYAVDLERDGDEASISLRSRILPEVSAASSNCCSSTG